MGAHLEWIHASAESYGFDQQYSAVVAAEALHWLDWDTVLPRIAVNLVADGHLVLVIAVWRGPYRGNQISRC